MSAQAQPWRARARRARAQLETLALSDPAVQMVSIGIDPERRGQAPALIVHVRHGATAPAGLPDEIDGMPVRVIYADYQLEQGGPT